MRAGKLAPGALGVGVRAASGRSRARSARRSQGVVEASRTTRTVDDRAARLAADARARRRARRRARSAGRRSPGAYSGSPPAQQLGAGVDGVLDLPVHPQRGGRRRSAARGRCAASMPGPTRSARARAASASRNGSATDAVHVHALDRPARLAGAGERARGDLLGRPLGVDARVDDREVAARGLLARADHEVDARVGATSGRAARSSPCRSCRIVAQVEQLDHPLAPPAAPSRTASGPPRCRSPARRPSAPQVAASGSHQGIRIATTPRGSRTTRSPRGGRAAVQRAELGVGLERARSRLDAAQRVRQRRPGLERLQLRQLAGVLAQPARRGLQQRAARVGRGPRPGALRGARAASTASCASGAPPAGTCRSPRRSRDRAPRARGCGWRCARSSIPVRSAYPRDRHSNTCGVRV